ncbi:LysR family transcriptional regulator [Nocardia sp. NPDC003482]
MELRHLRYFVAVAEQLHFGRAAEQLFVTQSTLSVQIRQLEDEVGGPLFLRTSRSVQLTDAGRLFHEQARRVLEQADRALRSARESVRGESGSLRIGFSGYAAYSGLLPTDLRAFHDRHPRVEIDVRELSPGGVADELRRGTIDLGYTPHFGPEHIEALTPHPRRRIHMVAALRDDHDLARKHQLSLTDLTDERLILPAPQTGTTTLADRIRPALTSLPEPRLVPTTLSVLTLASAGHGIALVPDGAHRLGIPGLTYRPISEPLDLEVVILTRPNDTSGTVNAYLADLSDLT